MSSSKVVKSSYSKVFVVVVILAALFMVPPFVGALKVSAFNFSVGQTLSVSVPVNLSNDTYQAHYPMIASVGSNVYVAWTEESHGIYFRSSSNNGLMWTPSTSLPAKKLSLNGGGSASYPVISANGSNVYVAWPETKSGLGQIFVAASKDNGISFSSPKAVSVFGYNSVTPVIASAGGNVYVAWRQTTVSTGSAYIEIATSNDNGATWSLQNMSAFTDQRQDEPQ